jgi:hypothetical protein
MNDKTLTAVNHLGLGAILRNHKLSVPANQREYSWDNKEVTTLLQDFASAIREGSEDYFLGTIVVVSKGANQYEIVDGQQRLATTALLLAAIRDYLRPAESAMADSINRDFLTSSSANRRDEEPKIQLNLADSEFFRAVITGVPISPVKHSHDLISNAYKLAAKQVKNIVAPYEAKQHGDVLLVWLNFIEFSAQVVMLTISSDGNAYRMFETLNDRGLKTTQADLVKNYLFGRAAARLDEAQDKWASMRGVLDALDEELFPTVVYLRHALMLKTGYFRENALHEEIQREAKAPNQVIALLGFLETAASDYAALFNSDSERWNGYPDAIRESIKALNLLNIASMRPLMLAVAAKFSPKEASIAFRKFISWHVRFLIAGSTLTGGYIEVPLAIAAKKIFDGEITDELSLTAEMLGRIPGDEAFKVAFATASVSKTALARYYLRSLEMVVKGVPDPCFIPNNDRETITCEHILPQKPLSNWPTFSEADARVDWRRIGNMALLQAKRNSDLKSAPFAEKKFIFEDSPYELTSQLAKVDKWTHERIVERQNLLSEYALKAWPL